MQRLWPLSNFLLAALLALPAFADSAKEVKEVDEASAADEACCGCKADEAACEKQQQARLEASEHVAPPAGAWRLVSDTSPTMRPASSASSDEPRLHPKAKSDHVFPQTEDDLITRRHWPNMPAFQIFPEPLPAPPVQPPAPQFGGVVPDILIWDANATRPVREYRVLSAPGQIVAEPAPVRAPENCNGDACATKANREPVPPTPSTQYSNLTMPTPTADPAQMVVHLFERLKQAEARAAEARRQLAETQVQLAKLCQAHTLRKELAVDFASTESQASDASQSAPAPAQVHLAMQVYEIDLDAAKDVDLSEFGVCAAQLSRVGLSGVTARGKLDSSKVSIGSSTCKASQSGEGCACFTKAEATACASLSCLATKAIGSSSSCPCQTKDVVRATPVVKSKSRIQAIAEKLRKDGAAEIVSRPQIVTTSGSAASFTVGQRVPVPEILFTASGEKVRALVPREVGLKIAITPHVADGEPIKLQVEAEWSRVSRLNVESTNYTVHRQFVGTTLELESNAPAILAHVKRIDGDEKGTRQELVVLGTPKIVKTKRDESVAAKPAR